MFCCSHMPEYFLRSLQDFDGSLKYTQVETLPRKELNLTGPHQPNIQHIKFYFLSNAWHLCASAGYEVQETPNEDPGRRSGIYPAEINQCEFNSIHLYWHMRRITQDFRRNPLSSFPKKGHMILVDPVEINLTKPMNVKRKPSLTALIHLGHKFNIWNRFSAEIQWTLNSSICKECVDIANDIDWKRHWNVPDHVNGNLKCFSKEEHTACR